MNERERQHDIRVRLDEVDQTEDFITQQQRDPEDINAQEVLVYLFQRRTGLIALQGAAVTPPEVEDGVLTRGGDV